MGSIPLREKFDTTVSCSKGGVGANDWAVTWHPKFSMKPLQSLFSLWITIAALPLSSLDDCAAFFGFYSKLKTACSLVKSTIICNVLNFSVRVFLMQQKISCIHEWLRDPLIYLLFDGYFSLIGELLISELTINLDNTIPWRIKNKVLFSSGAQKDYMVIGRVGQGDLLTAVEREWEWACLCKWAKCL